MYKPSDKLGQAISALKSIATMPDVEGGDLFTFEARYLKARTLAKIALRNMGVEPDRGGGFHSLTERRLSYDDLPDTIPVRSLRQVD